MQEEMEKQPRRQNKRHRTHRKKRTLLTVFEVFLAVVLLLAILGVCSIWYIQDRAANLSADPDQPEAPKSNLVLLAESSRAFQLAGELKSDYLLLMDLLKKADLPQTVLLREKIETDIQTMDRCMAEIDRNSGDGILDFSSKLTMAGRLLDLAKITNQALLDPLIECMQTYPLSTLKTDEGLRVETLSAYLEFAEKSFPAARVIADSFSSIDRRLFQVIDGGEKLLAYAESLTALLDECEPIAAYLPLFRAFLGNGADRLYIFAAQNTSEIRASGGFPGSVGAVRIRDGILTIEDFKTVYAVFTDKTLPEAEITDEEVVLFFNRMNLSWDADFSPDFERVARIWALAYQDNSQEHVDGVISATPVIIQRILSIAGEIELSDGTVLNGESAMRVLEHDLYFRYFSRDSVGTGQYRNSVADALFAETAKKTLHQMKESLSADQLLQYGSVFRQSVADRTLMLWMADETEQALVRRLGCSGGLNHDKTNPQLGVFFNSITASKMGWYLDIDAAIGEGTLNEDGSVTYPVVVSFSNRMTKEELNDALKYISGGTGNIDGGLYLFAPAGGSITNFRTSIGELIPYSYQGLFLVFQYLSITRDTPVVIECEVTTAPGVSAPLSIMQTPTAQNYRA
ncbi:MAG: DUF4012 domain-containing protein [Oscillospiraceae bacterium]|nr:DUF4012 domain-containing protein [Oscillospiraceae bacterium]